MLCKCAIIAGSISLLNGLLAARRTNLSFISLDGPLIISTLESVELGLKVFRML